MFDARIFLENLDNARDILNKNNAFCRGEYKIHDIIYKHKDQNIGIDKVFLRLRLVPLNIWNEKQYILSIKKTELKEIGKQSIIPIKKQFDFEKDARDFIKENYSNQFEFLYEFDRKGWQYDLVEDQVDLEDIEGYYSIEFKSKTDVGLKKLLEKFNIDNSNVIRSTSVVAIKEILGR